MIYKILKELCFDVLWAILMLIAASLVADYARRLIVFLNELLKIIKFIV